MKSLRELLGFCMHNWITISREEITVRRGKLVMFYEYVYNLRCLKCGKIRVDVFDTRN